MQKIITLLLATLLVYSAGAQNSFTVIIKDSKTLQPLSGASVILNSAAIGSKTDSTAIVELNNIPNGKQSISFSFTGYETITKEFVFPLADKNTIIIFLVAADEDMDEVITDPAFLQSVLENLPDFDPQLFNWFIE